MQDHDMEYKFERGELHITLQGFEVVRSKGNRSVVEKLELTLQYVQMFNSTEPSLVPWGRFSFAKLEEMLNSVLVGTYKSMRVRAEPIRGASWCWDTDEDERDEEITNSMQTLKGGMYTHPETAVEAIRVTIALELNMPGEEIV
jgi:hypothetical protein